MLDKQFQEEIIEWNEKCEDSQCRMKTKHIKKVKITKTSRVLIISLQRIIPGLDVKNKSIVKFYPRINLSKYSEKLWFNQDLSYTYDLKAVVNHYGNLSNGHYTADINLNGKWSEFDDESVKELNNINFVSDEAYTFYYVKTSSKVNEGKFN